MSEGEGYPAGTDVPGTPAPFPFGLIAAGSGFGALACGLVAMFAEPLAVYGYWLLSAEWVVLALIGISRERAKGIWIGAIGVLAPLVTSVILGSNALTHIPG